MGSLVGKTLNDVNPFKDRNTWQTLLLFFCEAIETNCPSLSGESDQPCLQHLETSKASFLSRTSSRNGLKAWYVLLPVVPESECEGFF